MHPQAGQRAIQPPLNYNCLFSYIRMEAAPAAADSCLIGAISIHSFPSLQDFESDIEDKVEYENTMRVIEWDIANKADYDY